MFDPWVGKIPRRREWLPTPVFLPGEFHGQRSLTGYSPSGCKESDMTESLTFCCLITVYVQQFLQDMGKTGTEDTSGHSEWKGSLYK